MALGSLLCQFIIFLGGAVMAGTIGWPMDGAQSALLVIMILCHLGAVITGCSVGTSTLSYGQIMTFQVKGKAAGIEMSASGGDDFPDNNQFA